MIVVLKRGTTEKAMGEVIEVLNEYPVELHISEGKSCTIIGLMGDETMVDEEKIRANPHVENVMRVMEPYKKANRKFHPENTVIDVCGAKIGGEKLAIIAGPCSVEGREQILSTAESVKASGAGFLRGGAYKPRTSPYAFQGMEQDGISLLMEAREKTGLPIVTEIMDVGLVERFERDVDVIQVGARNMQNFSLLKELGKTSKPILLKRALSGTIEELLMAAEYIMAGGNPNVILCERGIRTFETSTRNTTDITAIPVIKKLSHLPVVLDPSHSGGYAWLVPAIAKAAVVAGADGLIVEVHNDPESALCDGPQSLNPKQFDKLMGDLKRLAKFEERTI